MKRIGEYVTKIPKTEPVNIHAVEIVVRDEDRKKPRAKVMSEDEIDIALEACGRVTLLGC